MPQTANPNAAAPVRVTFVPPDSSETVQVEIDGALTGHAAILGLVEQAGLQPPSAILGYLLRRKRGGVELPLDRPLLENVQAEDVIIVSRSEIGNGRA